MPIIWVKDLRPRVVSGSWKRKPEPVPLRLVAEAPRNGSVRLVFKRPRARQPRGGGPTQWINDKWHAPRVLPVAAIIGFSANAMALDPLTPDDLRELAVALDRFLEGHAMTPLEILGAAK